MPRENPLDDLTRTSERLGAALAEWCGLPLVGELARRRGAELDTLENHAQGLAARIERDAARVGELLAGDAALARAVRRAALEVGPPAADGPFGAASWHELPAAVARGLRAARWFRVGDPWSGEWLDFVRAGDPRDALAATPAMLARESAAAAALLGRRGAGAQKRAEVPPARRAWNDLTDRQRAILLAARQLGALDADHRRTAADLAAQSEGRTVNPGNFKMALADLTMRGLLESSTGRAGGYWLGREGAAVVAAVEAGSGAAG